jgi:hypothetical protein
MSSFPSSSAEKELSAGLERTEANTAEDGIYSQLTHYPSLLVRKRHSELRYSLNLSSKGRMMVLLMLMRENFGYHDEIERRVDNMVSVEERWGTMW